MSIICNRCGKPLRNLSMGVFEDEKGYGVFIHRGCDCILRDPAIADQYETTNAIWLKFRLEECKVADAQGNAIEVDPEKILTVDYAPDGTILASGQPDEPQEAQEPIENAIPDNLPRCSNCEAWLDGRPTGHNYGFCCSYLRDTSPDELCRSFIHGRRICERCHFWINDRPNEPKGYCSHLDTRIEPASGCIDFKRRLE
ncbi:Uncharacterised protein [uncultured archaeon]|nr:Uncharacterised protein [uncultured archaeon]